DAGRAVELQRGVARIIDVERVIESQHVSSLLVQPTRRACAARGFKHIRPIFEMISGAGLSSGANTVVRSLTAILLRSEMESAGAPCVSARASLQPSAPRLLPPSVTCTPPSNISQPGALRVRRKFGGPRFQAARPCPKAGRPSQRQPSSGARARQGRVDGD